MSKERFIEEGRKIGKMISGVCSLMSRTSVVTREIVYEITNDHRTIQQKFGSLILLPLLRIWAADYAKGNYDLRNEALCKFAYQALEANDLYKECDFPYV